MRSQHSGRHRPSRQKLHRRLFLWFGLTIALTALTVFATSAAMGRLGAGDELSGWQRERERVAQFAAQRFAEVWDDGPKRHALAQAAATDLGLDLKLMDRDGSLLEAFGEPCHAPAVRLPILRDGVATGSVHVCWRWRARAGPGRGPLGLVPIALAVLVVWALSGKIARRIGRPLEALAQVARELGDGKLASRAKLRADAVGEVGALAESMNDMAAKLERQLAEQRELLAAVSHELRTPLTRMRVLIEMAQQREQPTEQLVELDKEIVEIDALVGELLASSRLDFAALRMTALTPRACAERALERANLPSALLVDEAGSQPISVDATLIARALANLIDNATKHGRGVACLRVKRRAGRVAFEVEDNGPGFSAEAASALFEPFSGGTDAASTLGLGLALVRRIAEAHGGTAHARNRDAGGACVGFEVSA